MQALVSLCTHSSSYHSHNSSHFPIHDQNERQLFSRQQAETQFWQVQVDQQLVSCIDCGLVHCQLALSGGATVAHNQLIISLLSPLSHRHTSAPVIGPLPPPPPTHTNAAYTRCRVGYVHLYLYYRLSRHRLLTLLARLQHTAQRYKRSITSRHHCRSPRVCTGMQNTLNKLNIVSLFPFISTPEVFYLNVLTLLKSCNLMYAPKMLTSYIFTYVQQRCYGEE